MLNKTIWIYWHQGKGTVPPMVAKCIQSWRDYNPDWQVHVLDAETLADWTTLPDRIDLSRSDLGVQLISDLVRICLLAEHGGVWVDASVYCDKPVDDWLPAASCSNFFAFEHPRRDRLLSSWFLASASANPLVVSVRDDMLSFFEQNTFSRQNTAIGTILYRVLKFPLGLTARTTRFWFHPITVRLLGIYPYFTLHYLFAQSISRDEELARIWQEVPKFAADVPHKLKHGYKMQLSAGEALKFVESDEAPMHKLLWQINLDEPYWRSVIAGLEAKRVQHIQETAR